jgi:NAD(P)H-dependent flavin oxidoreductase YrpB (nitropropane dioxygenase family)
MPATRFTELVGCKVPIQEAPVASWPRLAAAVADAGGLGMVSVSGWMPGEITRLLADLRGQTMGVFGANFLPFHPTDPVRECVLAAASGARVVDFFYFAPDAELVKIVHGAGALASWQVGSRAEAVAAEEAGCDFVIAQGIEAGGHVRGRLGVLPLLAEVLEAVDVPVLAAGGMGSGRGLAAALAFGAAGVRVGTRFVAAVESDAHPDWVQALIAAEAGDTIYTEAFSTGWPDAPHRVLRSSVEAATAFQGDIVGEEQWKGEPLTIRRFQPFPISRSFSGTVAATPFWAGESVGAVIKVQPAAEIVRELVDGAEQCLRRWC